jgi:hypothetical protein
MLCCAAWRWACNVTYLIGHWHHWHHYPFGTRRLDAYGTPSQSGPIRGTLLLILMGTAIPNVLAKPKARRIEPDHPAWERWTLTSHILRRTSVRTHQAPIIIILFPLSIIPGRCNPSPDRACTSCALKLATTHAHSSCRTSCLFRKHPRGDAIFCFQTGLIPPPPPTSPPSPSVHAQHHNWDDQLSTYPLYSHRNVNTRVRVGAHYPTSTTRDKRQCLFLTLSYFRRPDTPIYAVPYAFPVSPVLLIQSLLLSIARVTALHAASDSSKKWPLMPSFNAHSLP